MATQDNRPQPTGLIGEQELTPQEIAAINYVRNVGYDIGAMLDQIANFPSVDMRWLAVARTDLQKGFQSIERAIACPPRF